MTQDFDFEDGTFEEFLENWRGCEDVTNWVADKDDDRDIDSVFTEFCYLPSDQQKITDEHVIYTAYIFSDEEIKEFYIEESKNYLAA